MSELPLSSSQGLVLVRAGVGLEVLGGRGMLNERVREYRIGNTPCRSGGCRSRMDEKTAGAEQQEKEGTWE